VRHVRRQRRRRLATAVVDGSSSLTITLYDRYLPAGRTQLGQVVVNGGAPLFVTNLEFTGGGGGNTRVVFGENGSTAAIYAADFGNALPTVTSLSANGSFPGVQGVDVVGGQVLASGTTAAFVETGKLYLRTLNPSTGATTTVVENAGTGYPAGPASARRATRPARRRLRRRRRRPRLRPGRRLARQRAARRRRRVRRGGDRLRQRRQRLRDHRQHDHPHRVARRRHARRDAVRHRRHPCSTRGWPSPAGSSARARPTTPAR
jgi:hypothetical protein